MYAWKGTSCPESLGKHEHEVSVKLESKYPSVDAISNRLVAEIDKSQSQSYVTTDSQSASLSWCQAPIWDPRPTSLSP
jgi:hypothetical protein